MSYECKKPLTDAEILTELRKIENESSGEEFEFSDSDQDNETTFASPGSQSKTDTGQPTEEKETAKDGTEWKIVAVGSNAGRLQSHNILRESSGPSYAKRKIESGKLLSAWRLIFSASMMRHIKHCT
ncbi:uncharacterized protein LOC126106186 [Schistocerca cancellata]|uniref:uncharacterized protein LOC126106186 n=1 Tax=Schistocerca cancellata TaxID=274614 RepID=UPI0021181447|nr:uncharacterized protein LOC126106186 [Schistocerca cancellata]